MTMHPERAVLLAHVDGELSEPDERRTATHIAGCASCEAAAADLRAGAASFRGTLHALDEDEPVSWVQLEDSAAVRVLPLPVGRRTRGTVTPGTHGVRGRRVLGRAAGILLISCGTAVAAVAGLRVLTDARLTDTMSGAGPQVTVEPSVAGIVVTPVNDAIRVELTGAGADSRLFVTLDDAVTASVTVEGAESPRFTPVADGMIVDLRDESAVVRLIVPRNVREVTVTSGAVTLVTMREGVITPASAAHAGILLDANSQPAME